MQTQTIPLGLCQCGCGRETRIATQNDVTTNRVIGRPARYVPGHGARQPIESKYHVEDRGYETPCWIWTRYITLKTGYGHWRNTSAHRAMYIEKRGPIPGGLPLDHLCRVRSCVNPDHLEPVTYVENQRRGLNTKHDRIALVARIMYWTTTLSQEAVADMLGLKRGAVQKIIDGRRGYIPVAPFNSW